jgi:hypothetical protein
MLERLREFKNAGECLRALLLLDDSPRASAVWKAAASRHPQAVIQILSEMTESDDKWNRLRNPAALAMKTLRQTLENATRKHA